MSQPFESDAFRELLVVLGATGLVIPAFAAIRISPVVGFIIVGVAVGPHGLAALVPQLPALALIALPDPGALEPAAEIGIAMLLFTLGLNLSFDRLKTMRRLVFGIGAAQLGLCALLLGLALLPLGLNFATTAALALALALSSTAVGLQMLASSGHLNTRTGRTAYGVLLFQDIAIAPILLVLAAGAASEGPGPALLKGLLGIGLIVVIGRLVLRPLFLQAARTRSPELFLAASLVVAIAAAAVTAAVGLSPVIGALIAGVLLAETEYHRQIEAAIAPFQGLLLGVFLIWVGMSLDLAALAAQPLTVLAALLAVVVIKTVVVALVLRARRRGWGLSAHVALLLAAPSETSLVVLGAATAAGLLTGEIATLALITVGLGLALAPLLGIAGAWAEGRFGPRIPVAAVAAPTAANGRTVIIGFGRVGQMVGDMLDVHHRDWLAVDSDPDAVARFRGDGRPVVYGDARRPELLDQLGLDTAAAVVLTVDAAASLDALARRIRDHHPALCVVARARDADHAAHLYAIGVTDAVPETVESSLQLAEAVLADLGVPMGLVIASIHEKRAELRAAIQGSRSQAPRQRGKRLRDTGG